MEIKNLSQAELMVGASFVNSEKVKKILNKMTGPGMYCYNSTLLLEFIQGRLSEKKSVIINEHLLKCKWCKILAGYGIILGNDIARAESINKGATKYYINNKILFELYNSESLLAQKIKMAWNTL